jgi:hypothetical protein
MTAHSTRSSRLPWAAAGFLLLGLLLLGGPARAQIVPCASDDQCATVVEGHVCATSPRGGLSRCGCHANADCPAPLICDTSFSSFGICNDAPCSDSSTCAMSPYGHVCDQMTCICNSDADCQTGRTCQQGTCFEAPCATDPDCSTNNFGKLCMSQQGQHFCGCNQTSDCLTGLVCDNRFVSQGGPASCSAACTSDANCTGGRAAGPHCDVQSGLCGCGADSDCSVREVCDPTIHLCTQVPCMADTDCSSDPGGFLCITVTGQCGCSGDNDCPVGQVCDSQSSSCTPPSCMSNADCAGHADGTRCDTATGSCGCDADTDCPAGNVCNTQLLFCVAPPPGVDGGPDSGVDGSTADAGSDGPGTPDLQGGVDQGGGGRDATTGRDSGNGSDTGKGGGCSTVPAAGTRTELSFVLLATLALGLALRRRRS